MQVVDLLVNGKATAARAAPMLGASSLEGSLLPMKLPVDKGTTSIPEGMSAIPAADGGGSKLPTGEGRLPNGEGRLPNGEGRLLTCKGKVPTGEGRLPTDEGTTMTARASEVSTDSRPKLCAMAAGHVVAVCSTDSSRLEPASGGNGEGSDVAPAVLDTALDCIRRLLLAGRAASLASRICFSIEAARTTSVVKSSSSFVTW